MSVLLTGKVFNDLSHTGIYTSLYPGIPYVLVTLICPDYTLLTAQTDSTGTYTFYGLNLSGEYTLLEITYAEDEKTIPLLFEQPLGLNGSTTVRKYTFTLSDEQITEETPIEPLHFGHDLSEPFSSAELAYIYNAKEHALDTLNLITGDIYPFTKLDSSASYKILAFNPLDYFIYGYDLDKGTIIRLSSDGKVSSYFVAHLPHRKFTVGTINHQGHLYLYEPLDSAFYIVDINPYSPTYMHLLDPHREFKEASSSVGYSIKPLDISACCFNPQDSLFYTINSNGHLMSINLPLNEIKYLPTTGTPPFAAYMMMCDYEGYLYCLFEDISFIYRITLSSSKAFSEIFSPLSAHSISCGVRCYNSPTYIGLGSAPDSSPLNGPKDYSTTLAHNGPRHGITNILYFGKEDLSYLKPASLSITDTSYKLTVPITNHTGKDAHLYGWLDLDANGVFQPHESLEPLLIPHTLQNEVSYSLVFNIKEDTPIALGDTYMRLRLTTDTLSQEPSTNHLEDSRSLGPASDGQIIDLPLTIIALPPTSIDPIKSFCEIGKNISGISQANDPCGGDLHYKIKTFPHHGTAGVHPHTGSWDYRPHENFVGEDTFILSVTSSRSHLSTDIPISITIQKAALKVSTTPIHLECLLGDTVTYTTTIENIGTVPITDLIYTHPLPSGSSFTASSVHINNIRDRSASPEHGINLHKLSPGEVCMVTFQISLASPAKEYLSQGIVRGTYVIASKHDSYTQESNRTQLTTKSPDLLLDLNSNLLDAFLEDTLQYTLKVTNTGDLPLSAVRLMLSLPPELQCDQQLMLNHTCVCADLSSGYSIENLLPNDTLIVQFNAKVLKSSTHSTVQTTLFASYTYTLNEISKVSDDLSVQCPLNICIPNLEITSQLNKQALSLGEFFNYTLTAINHSHFLAEESVIKGSFPEEVQIIDIHCNNKPIPNTLDTGLSLGKLSPLKATEIVIKLKLISIPHHKELVFQGVTGIFTLLPLKSGPNKIIYVDSPPPPALPITDVALHLYKSISTPEAAVGETITYTITLSNSGTIPLNQVTVRDLLCPELKFVVDSIVLNGKPLLHTSLMSGIIIDNLLPNQSQILSFNCLILDRGTGVLENACSAYYTYKPHHSTYVKSGSSTSNAASLIIRQAHLNLLGNVSQALAFLDDELSYDLEISNTGDMDVFNVFLNSHVEGCELIDGTFMINNLVIYSINLLEPINIGSILKGQSTYIHYKVKTIGHCHFEDTLTNKAFVTFAYTTMDQCIKYDKSSELDLTIPLALSTFKQLSLDNFLEVPCTEPDMELINTIGGQVSLLKNYIIDTPTGLSPEGQKLSGKKLIVHALLELTVEYVAGMPNQPIHSIYYTIPFSTFIILPKECPAHSLMHIDATIDNISFKVLNNRSFFSNSSLLLIARIK